MNQKKRVLFLCVANSCRSQISEGLTRHFLGEYIEPASAGSTATYVNPNAIKVMAEIGIDISGHRSKEITEFYGQSFDLVVTVCDDGGEQCPVWLGAGEKAHVGFPDPVKATGTEEEILQVFRNVRDDIKKELLSFLKTKFVIE